MIECKHFESSTGYCLKEKAIKSNSKIINYNYSCSHYWNCKKKPEYGLLKKKFIKLLSLGV